MTDPTDDAFRRSYKDFASYPINLIFPYGNLAALEDYRARLDAAGRSLFNPNPEAIRVAFREFDALGTGSSASPRMDRANIMLTRLPCYSDETEHLPRFGPRRMAWGQGKDDRRPR